MYKFSAFFISTGKSFQRLALIVLTISKPNLLVLMFRRFTVVPDLRLLELFSLKLNLSLIMRGKGPFLLHILPLASIYSSIMNRFITKLIYQDSIIH